MNTVIDLHWTTVATGCVVLMIALSPIALPDAPSRDTNPAQELQIEITKKGAGKEVSMRKGAKEWFMLIEVTPENTVVIRQEKENETYLVDESETHDRPLSPGEVDAVVDDFVNSVKHQTKRK
jgi:hypothetical protein